MDEFRELIKLPWILGKFFFENMPETTDDYSKITDMGNDMLKKFKPGTKEYRLICRYISATNEYLDTYWRETHTGEQTSLF